jgi:hypothetical protein
MHLTPEQLIDIAEGTIPAASASHLATCEACGRQLADLRAMMSAVAAVDVPEPSPLFWDHLSARVSDAVAVEPPPNGWNWWLRAAMPFALATAAALAIAFVMVTRLIAPPVLPTPATGSVAPDVTDPSLSLVADLAEDIGWDQVREAGLAPRGSADHAVTHLSEGELQQLRDLLQEAMTKSSD